MARKRKKNKKSKGDASGGQSYGADQTSTKAIGEANEMTLTILWAAMMASQLFFAFAAWVTGPASRSLETPAVLLVVLGIAAASSTGAAVWGVPMFAAALVPDGRYLTYCVLRWAIAEVAGILGLVAVFSGVPLVYALPFFGLGVVGVALCMPSVHAAGAFYNRVGNRVSARS